MNDLFQILHLLLPFLIRLFIPNFWRCLTYVYLWESFEQLLFEFYETYLFFPFAKPGQETQTNSLLFDPFQGFLGILWAHCLISWNEIPQYPEQIRTYVWFTVLFIPANVFMGSEIEGFALGFPILLVCTLFFLMIMKIGSKMVWWNSLIFILFCSIPFPSVMMYRTWYAWLFCVSSTLFTFFVREFSRL